MSDLINSQFSFGHNGKLTADISRRALEKFSKGFESARKLEGDLPIILDTNILLGYYGMSQLEKSKLLKFIEAYSKRIYITKQVEQEFLRNRLSVIKKDFFEPLGDITTDFKTLQRDITNILRNYKDKRKKLLSQDYPALWDQLEGIEKFVLEKIDDKEFLSAIEKEVGKTTKENVNISLSDEMLNVVSTLKQTDALDNNEIEFLENEFQKLLTIHKDAKENTKWRFAIPGCGDKKEDASGDFIIFHEILKFMKKASKSCIFLTNDFTKGDWFQLDRSPHLHYVENTFVHTDNVMFIIHAERTLTNISFENIHKESLEIVSAQYGTAPDKLIDVTELVVSRIVNNRLTIRASNDLAGDPNPGVVKSLSILYRIGQRQIQATIVEGATHTIPDE